MINLESLDERMNLKEAQIKRLMMVLPDNKIHNSSGLVETHQDDSEWESNYIKLLDELNVAAKIQQAIWGEQPA